ncbi:MAG: BrxA/BrxB family bacilliredoxin [bacterium]|nr:BrxA/BrxB family bacilliredoxin [bacterium]
MPAIYDRKAVEFMWKELNAVGVPSLTRTSEVDKFMKEKKGTALIVVNSVCGCAARNARPGVALALQNSKIPDRLATVFAGLDKDAARAARAYIKDYRPSSPSVALFKDGEVTFMLERKDIEGFTAWDVSKKLIKAFNEHCTAKGPSVAKSVVEKTFDLK